MPRPKIRTASFSVLPARRTRRQQEMLDNLSEMGNVNDIMAYIVRSPLFHFSPCLCFDALASCFLVPLALLYHAPFVFSPLIFQSL